MKVTYNKETQRVPIKIWADEVEDTAKQQLHNLSTLPFVYKHIAAMPDVHAGHGSTVGTVIATNKAIIPAAVGVDIGCGMLACKLNLNHKQIEDNLHEIRMAIENFIPVGFRSHDKNRLVGTNIQYLTNFDSSLKDKASKQLGTLGAGNHFIEICLDENKDVWLMLHSGSRGLGNIVATRHIDNAKGIMKKMFIELPDPDLAYFAENTIEFDDYIKDLKLCQDYASENRWDILRLCEQALYSVFFQQISFTNLINCHHNYTEKENHFDKNIWVTRKGAVRARKNDYGIIPSAMGQKSYIVKGLGNPESFCSCSHGAGRKMSRTQARNTFTQDDIDRELSQLESRKDISITDELPSAYKDIDVVMANQKDLVEIVHTLKAVLCVKG